MIPKFASEVAAIARELRNRSSNHGHECLNEIHASIDVNDELLFREELEGTIALHIDSVTKLAVLGRKDGNDDTVFVVGRFFNPFADRKFGHSEPPPGIFDRNYPPNLVNAS